MSTSTYKARLHQLVEDLSEDEAARAHACLAGARAAKPDPSAGRGGLAERFDIAAAKVRDLRYGENPHQAAALYGYVTHLEPELSSGRGDALRRPASRCCFRLNGGPAPRGSRLHRGCRSRS